MVGDIETFTKEKIILKEYSISLPQNFPIKRNTVTYCSLFTVGCFATRS